MTTLPVSPPLVGDAARLAALRQTGVLDTGPEAAYDGAVLLARTLCAAPVALISLVAEERQWFKARSGFGPEETSLDASVCSHALSDAGLLIIPDLMQDDRTRDNPLVIAGPRLRFYAGAPLRTADGHALGTLCVLDPVPRPDGLTPEQAEGLQALATLVMALLAARRTAG